MSNRENPAEPAGLQSPPPRYPEYSTLESRLQSFTGWPQSVVGVTPQSLADCGFYYIGSADRVRCFQCGVTLRNWDSGDDPFTEHMNWSSDCAFLLALALTPRGDSGFRDLQRHDANSGENISVAREPARVNAVQIRGLGVNLTAGGEADTSTLIHPTSTNETPETASSAETSERVPGPSSGEASIEPDEPLSPMVQAVIDMGYSRDVVNRARAAKRQRDGEDFTDASLLLSAIFDMEVETDSPATTGLASSSGHSSISEVQRQSSSPHTAADAPEASLSSSGSASTRPQPLCAQLSNASTDASAQPQTPSSAASAQALSASADASAGTQASGASNQPRLRKARPGRCQLCGEAEIAVTFLPCGHLISCQVCAELCQQCPVCDKKILGSVKIFFA